MAKRKTPRSLLPSEPCVTLFTLRVIAENRVAGGARSDLMGHIRKCTVCSRWLDYYRSRKKGEDKHGR